MFDFPATNNKQIPEEKNSEQDFVYKRIITTLNDVRKYHFSMY